MSAYHNVNALANVSALANFSIKPAYEDELVATLAIVVRLKGGINPAGNSATSAEICNIDKFDGVQGAWF